MKDRQRLEREFEELLVEVLMQDYDLDVRRWGDAMDRRRKNIGTLCFDYHYEPKSPVGKAVVSLDEADDFTSLMKVDFSSPERMLAAAEDCEALALFLSERLDERRDELLGTEDPIYGDGDGDGLGRREDDYL